MRGRAQKCAGGRGRRGAAGGGMVRRCSSENLGRDLRGQVGVVTGAASGIGAATAGQLAGQGMTVVVTARSAERAREAAAAARAAWREDTPFRGEVIPVVLDNADLDSVRAGAREIMGRFPKLDLLVNNAGVMGCPLSRTSQGHELQLGVNHLSHFELTNQLIPALRAAGKSRILCVASSASVGNVRNPKERATIDFEDPNWERREYKPLMAYSASKLANVLHARALAGRLRESGVTAVSLHPGIIDTSLFRHFLKGPGRHLFKVPGVKRALTYLIFGNNYLDAFDGAQTTLHCALDPSVPNHAGAFFSQDGPYGGAKILGRGFSGGWPMRNPNPDAEDAELAERLWSLSEVLVARGSTSAGNPASAGQLAKSAA